MCKNCPPATKSVASIANGFRKMPPPPAFGDLPGTGDAGFDHAIRVILKHEGVFSNDPTDPGGATKYGISLRTAKALGDFDKDGKLDLDLDGDGDIDVDDIRTLIPQEAARIYKEVFWNPYPYRYMPKEIAVKTFDLAVNMGSKQAHIILQRAIRAVGTAVAEDGALGPVTIAAIKASSPSALLAAIRSEAASFYRVLTTQKPKLKKYINGWLYRAYY